MTHAFPSVTRDDIDSFEERLGEVLEQSTLDEIEAGLRKAMRFVEVRAEAAGLNMNHINNATSTAMQAFGQVATRLSKAEQELAQLKSEQTA